MMDATFASSATASSQQQQQPQEPQEVEKAPFVMPAEWTPHQACIILYPHSKPTFLRLRQAQEQIRNVAKAIVDQGDEDVVFFCLNDAAAKELQEMLDQEMSKQEQQILLQRMHVLICPSNDTWARDTAATFLIPSEDAANHDSDESIINSSNQLGLVGLDWEFNGYGGPTEGAYWPCDLDQQIAKLTCLQLSSLFQIPISLRHVPLVLEGGSIHTDGEGTVLTTEECLLHPNRNPSMSKQDIEQHVLSALGCTKMIWLPYGLAADDDTNGHIDNMACFASPTHVILSWCDDIDHDPDNYQRCRAAWHVLQQETDAKGRSLTIHKLHVPQPPMYYSNDDMDDNEATTTNATLGSSQHQDEEREQADSDNYACRLVGQRLAASYVNFYIANRAVIVPQFDPCPETNQRALETLQQVFPDRTVVGVSSREILLGGGNIHCMTQQVPLSSTSS